MTEVRHPESGIRKQEVASAKSRPSQLKEIKIHRVNAKLVSKELKPPKKEANVAPSAVLKRAVQIIGNASEAMRWMGTPVRDLEYETPISLLHSRKGCKAVLAVLEKLEYGVL